MTAEEKKKPKIELPDVFIFIGLALLFTGLGFSVSWPIAAAVVGAVLIGLAIWMVAPNPPRKGG